MLYYNKSGKNIDFEAYWKLERKSKYRIIKEEVLKNKRFISTVWQGTNINFGKGKPQIFETLVFPTKGRFLDLYGEKYSTLKEARQGHKRLAKEWSEK